MFFRVNQVQAELWHFNLLSFETGATISSFSKGNVMSPHARSYMNVFFHLLIAQMIGAKTYCILLNRSSVILRILIEGKRLMFDMGYK